jgi:hypothetical protein
MFMGSRLNGSSSPEELRPQETKEPRDTTVDSELAGALAGAATVQLPAELAEQARIEIIEQSIDRGDSVGD